MRSLSPLTLAAGLMLIAATTADHSDGTKPLWPCCTVWSAFHNACIEGSKDYKQPGCALPRFDGILAPPMDDPPKGEWAIPDDCAIWRIQSKKCLIAKKGYPGDYVNDLGMVVHGGQME